MHSIAITNQKGGVGKTTTSVNLGAALARHGQRVCLVDLDPQSHLTMHLGLEPGQAKPSVYELLGGSASLDETVRTVRPNVDLVPAEIDLAGAEVELVGVVGREKLLRDALYPAQGRYDVLLIDCPPSLGLLTINALSAVEEIFIALQPHFLAMQGLGKLLETVSLVQRRINEALSIRGVVLCMYDLRTALCGEVAAEVTRFFQSEHPLQSLWEQAHIFRTRIRRNIRLAEAPGHGQTIFEYAPSSHGAEDYEALAEELLAVWQGTWTDEPAQAEEIKPEESSGVEGVEAPGAAAQTTQSAEAANEISDTSQAVGATDRLSREVEAEPVAAAGEPAGEAAVSEPSVAAEPIVQQIKSEQASPIIAGEGVAAGDPPAEDAGQSGGQEGSPEEVGPTSGERSAEG